MVGKNGVEFATELRKFNKNFYLVFLTAHFEYSLLSFKCKTFDYLLKPISSSALLTIFKRFKDELSSPTNKVFINIKRGEADGARIAHTADFRRDAAGRRTLTPEGEGKGAMLMNSE